MGTTNGGDAMTETPKLTPFRTADMEKWAERYKGNLMRTSTQSHSYVQALLHPGFVSLCIENIHSSPILPGWKRLRLMVLPESHPVGRWLTLARRS